METFPFVSDNVFQMLHYEASCSPLANKGGVVFELDTMDPDKSFSHEPVQSFNAPVNISAMLHLDLHIKSIAISAMWDM